MDAREKGILIGGGFVLLVVAFVFLGGGGGMIFLKHIIIGLAFGAFGIAAFSHYKRYPDGYRAYQNIIVGAVCILLCSVEIGKIGIDVLIGPKEMIIYETTISKEGLFDNMIDMYYLSGFDSNGNYYSFEIDEETFEILGTSRKTIEVSFYRNTKALNDLKIIAHSEVSNYG